MSDFEELAGIFAKINDSKTMEKLFDELLTESERDRILLRWLLMKELYEGESQRNIASKYKISLCKITRGSKILKDDQSALKVILDEYYKNKGDNKNE